MIVDFRRGRHLPLSPVHRRDCGGSGLQLQAHQRLYFLRRLRRAGLGSSVLTSFYRCVVESVLSSCIIVWHGSCSAAEKKALQRVVKAAQRTVGRSLPTTMDIYTSRCRKRASCIMKDPTHTAHALFVPLPSGRRLRSIKSRTTRLRNSFFPDAPAQEVLVYALLDSQSDTTFVLSEIAESLEVSKEPIKLKLSTMTSRTTLVSSQRIDNLQVRGFYTDKKISLPPVYTRDFIPTNRSHIPTNETAKAWSHLEHLQGEMAPLQDCEVGLLIGYNCSQALLPREVVSGKENEPYAQRKDLGWSVVGHGNPCLDYGDNIGISHHIVVRRVTPGLDPSVNLRTEVHYGNRIKVKEIIPSDIINILESDFSERARENDPVSQEDLKFLAKLKKNITQKDSGHYEMPLPFKEEAPKLPNNKPCAMHRLNCLERRLKKDQTYYQDYVKFMDDIISRGDAEKVPEDETDKSPAWYIPHHGIYHPQ
ncbi:hypothetical protein L3Q82_019485 [Scortum barcoo]|uniref:Uncharacterized protein n=1 Tax=Scortum barcoo TaxID=214431 RepID=A0ACB8VDD0_9TELE|nr:hypothetical protein L3Q82_019485 [Scortum barcoo]